MVAPFHVCLNNRNVLSSIANFQFRPSYRLSFTHCLLYNVLGILRVPCASKPSTSLGPSFAPVILPAGKSEKKPPKSPSILGDFLGYSTLVLKLSYLNGFLLKDLMRTNEILRCSGRAQHVHLLKA
jgi:hypothetical protein